MKKKKEVLKKISAEAQVQPLSAEEFDVSFSGAALAVNKIFTAVGPHGVRMAFAEQYSPDKPSMFRTAVLLPFQDAISLKNVLTSLLKDIEPQIEAAANSASTAAEDGKKNS